MPKKNLINIYGISKLDRAIVLLQDYIKKSKDLESYSMSTLGLTRKER
jgi:hypothetical protein